MFFLFTGSLYPLMAQTTDSSHANSTNSTTMMKGMSSGTETMHSMNSGAPAALPVIENSVPDAVVAKAKEKFGTTLYDITCAKHAADQNAYVVRVQTNGVYSTQWIDDNGNTVQ